MQDAENSTNRKNYTKEKLEEILAYLKEKELEKTSPYHQFKELCLNTHPAQSNRSKQSQGNYRD